MKKRKVIYDEKQYLVGSNDTYLIHTVNGKLRWSRITDPNLALAVRDALANANASYYANENLQDW